MRIVAGQYRGKKLWSPEGKDVRPTSERAREAIFNILYSRMEKEYGNINLIDIFAGTGAFGLEALSRGVKSVTFVDLDTTWVQKNAKLFAKEQAKIKIIKSNALNLPRVCNKFEMLFMDAPYAKGLTEETLKEVIKKEYLSDKAICIVEIKHDEDIVIPCNFELLDERVYGLARVLFLRFHTM